MLIALDYDGAYTRDPGLWQAFIQTSVAAGHDIRVVTSRHPEDRPAMEDCRVICTGMQPKGPFLVSRGWVPDIWIDDHPERIFR
jgi:hypothetical protein